MSLNSSFLYIIVLVNHKQRHTNLASFQCYLYSTPINGMSDLLMFMEQINFMLRTDLSTIYNSSDIRELMTLKIITDIFTEYERSSYFDPFLKIIRAGLHKQERYEGQKLLRKYESTNTVFRNLSAMTYPVPKEVCSP